MSVDMDVTEVYNLERFLPRRNKSLRVRGSGLRKRHRERVHSRGSAESKHGIAKLSRSLASGRDRSQVMRENGTLVGDRASTDIRVFDLPQT